MAAEQAEKQIVFALATGSPTLYRRASIQHFPICDGCSLSEIRGQVEVGARHYQAGTVMIGEAEAYRELFGWPDLTAVLSDLDSHPERIAAISRRNAKEALLRHDWVYRRNEMLRLAGIEPSPHMAARERHLKDMADFVASAKVNADSAPKSRTDQAGMHTNEA
jgi:hypothetical protein